mgnify:CR=1 FL=1
MDGPTFRCLVTQVTADVHQQNMEDDDDVSLSLSTGVQG